MLHLHVVSTRVAGSVSNVPMSLRLVGNGVYAAAVTAHDASGDNARNVEAKCRGDSYGRRLSDIRR